jgi:hypothetical protein
LINTNTYKGGHNDYSNYGGEVKISDFDTENSRNKSHYYASRIANDFDFDEWCKQQIAYHNRFSKGEEK